jgi:cbb3-type cytochrome oxidase cytochrome c subunit
MAVKGTFSAGKLTVLGDELDALIAYLQGLGLKAAPADAVPATAAVTP